MLIVFGTALILFAPTGCGNYQPSTSTVVVAFGGDTFFDRKLQPLMDKGFDFFKDIRAASEGSDLFIINLETPVSTNGAAYDKPFVFRADPSVIALLTNAHVNVVSLANNHMLDFGIEAIIDTRNLLAKAKIDFAGAGTNLAQASKPVIIEKNGIKIGYLSFGLNGPLDLMDATPKRPGTAPIQLTNILPILKELRAKADFIIVSLHDGEEYKDLPIPRVFSNYHAIIDGGADLIIGHHPHIIQGIEKHGNGVIFYSMGNLLFDQVNNITLPTMIANVKITKKISAKGVVTVKAEYSVIPMMRDRVKYLPEFASKKEAAAITAHLAKISVPLGGMIPVFSPQTGKPYPVYSIGWTNK